MKFKASFIALALAVLSSAASAAPALQSCNPMEVIHNGGNGLSYSLECVAGDWKLAYSGSVPAGNDQVTAKYRLAIMGSNGEAFTQSRQVRVPSPSMLGQVLLREAVLLDGGDLALRECEPVGCTQYRPLGASAVLTRATITGSQEIARLAGDNQRLEALTKEQGAALIQVKADLNSRVAEVNQLKLELGIAQAKQAELQQQAELEQTALKQQAAAEQAALKAKLAEPVAITLAPSTVTLPPVECPVVEQVQTGAAPAMNAVVSAAADKMMAALTAADGLTSKLDNLRIEHEETLRKLDRAQNEAAAAAARLETVKLTLSLTAQNLAIAHADLDVAHAEIADLKSKGKGSTTTSPTEKSSLSDTLSRVASALVTSNTEVERLKAELARMKAPVKPSTTKPPKNG